MNFTENEMRGVIKGQALPADIRVGESVPAYLVRKFAEVAEERDSLKELVGNDSRITACINAFEGIPTERIEGKDLGQILAGELRLNGAGPRADGGFGFEFSGGVCQLLAEAYADQFKNSGAINYLELLFNHTEIGPLTITMQRVQGLTPAKKLAQSESERDRLQEQVRALAALAEERRKFIVNGAELGYIQLPVFDHDPATATYQRCFLKPKFAADSAIREIRAQTRAEGIHFAANSILAAWESGFIDDTPAAVHDISGAILSTVEFLQNADEGEFKRDYADEVRARIRAGEQP